MRYLPDKSVTKFFRSQSQSQHCTNQICTFANTKINVQVRFALYSWQAPTISYDFVSGDSDPRNEAGDWHGTRCAGIASAAKDGEACGIGVAYNSQFAGNNGCDVLGMV